MYAFPADDWKRLWLAIFRVSPGSRFKFVPTVASLTVAVLLYRMVNVNVCETCVVNVVLDNVGVLVFGPFGCVSLPLLGNTNNFEVSSSTLIFVCNLRQQQ